AGPVEQVGPTRVVTVLVTERTAARVPRGVPRGVDLAVRAVGPVMRVDLLGALTGLRRVPLVVVLDDQVVRPTRRSVRRRQRPTPVGVLLHHRRLRRARGVRRGRRIGCVSGEGGCREAHNGRGRCGEPPPASIAGVHAGSSTETCAENGMTLPAWSPPFHADGCQKRPGLEGTIREHRSLRNRAYSLVFHP